MSMEIRKCGIASCKYYHNPAAKGSDVYFFKIPSQTTEIGKKWVHALKILTFSGIYVCSLHFQPSDVEVDDTSIKGIKYVKLKRGAVPMNFIESLAVKRITGTALASNTIQFVDVEAIKKGTGIQNHKKETPLKPLILQPRLSTPCSLTKSHCSKSGAPNVESKTNPPQRHLQLSDCAQCKVYSEKLKLAEKRCQELEEFIRTNMNRVNVEDENSLDVSMLTNETCEPVEVSTKSHLNGKEGALSDDEDTANFDDNDIEYVPTEVPSDNASDNDNFEMMDQMRPAKLKIVERTQTSQINVNKPDLKVPKTVIMYNYYKCDFCKAPTTFNSNSELRNHQKQCGGYGRPSLVNPYGIANQAIVYNNTGQTIFKPQKIPHPPRWVEPQKFVNTMRGSYSIPHIEPSAKVLKISSIDAAFKCGVCEESTVFKTAIDLQGHMKEVHGGETNERDASFKCGICNGSTFIKTLYELCAHMKEAHRQIIRYECYICKIKLSGFVDARQHNRLHVQARTEECKVCDELWTPEEFNRHLCAGEKSIQCEYCTKSFGAIVKLIGHIETEHETEKVHHRCSKCSRIFEMALLKDLHEMQHKEVPKKHICEICWKAFSTNYGYECHRERQHSSKRNHLCSECGKGFFTATLLTAHSQIHRGKYIQCPDCPATFNTKRLLSIHREMHYPVKIKCNLCPKVLTGRRALQRHKRYIHNPKEVDKKHACPFCPYKVNKKDNLQVHLRSHTGEKPFACEYCPDRKFKHKGDLTKHLQSHFGDNIYKCDSCEKVFRLLDDLRRHSFEHYKEEQEKLGTDKRPPTNINSLN